MKYTIDDHLLKDWRLRLQDLKRSYKDLTSFLILLNLSWKKFQEQDLYLQALSSCMILYDNISQSYEDIILVDPYDPRNLLD